MAHTLILVLEGVSEGSVLFLIAIGLTLTIGVMRLLNFGNGAFFMLGGYMSYVILSGRSPNALELLLGIVAGALVTGLVGAVAELGVVRRLYHLGHLLPLLGTYALLLVLEGLAVAVWGNSPKQTAQAPEFRAIFEIGGVTIPAYDLVLDGAGVVCVLLVGYLVNWTRFGRRVRATAADREMASALGINVRLVFFLMFCLSTVMAGIAGGLTVPLINLTPDIAGTYLVLAFAVIIIGGMGSIPGAYVAALGVGVLQSLLISIKPQYAEVSVFAVMALMILLRPQGLFGRRQLEQV